MAIKFYGSCSGTSGGKYDIWLGVKENFQSIENNSTNITVKLFLKRNDSISASAYNLNESDNSVTLTVGGTVRVKKNIAVDTRNGATVTLAAWTGDVTHGTDGSLSLSVSGSFKISGTGLSGGSVNGNFDCTDIPRASTLTLSKTVLCPGDTVGAVIKSASSKFSHRVKWILGSSSVTHTLAAGIVKDSFTVPLSWSEEITEGKSGKIKVVLSTYKGSENIGTKSCYINFKIPDNEEFLPSFSLVTQRIDKNVPPELGEYVKSKSQIKVDIRGLTLKHGATVFGYSVKVGDAAVKTLPAVFDINKAGELDVSVTVKDSRGFSVKKSTVISVCDYSAPFVKIKSLSRCDESGIKSTVGTRVLAEYEPVFSSLNGKNTAKVTYRYRKADSQVYSGELELNGSPCVLPEGVFLDSSSYIVEMRITDLITGDGEFYERSVPSSAVPFNIRRGGTGASFGCYAEHDNRLTVAWDLDLKGQLIYKELPLEISEGFSEPYSEIRYYPPLGTVLLRVRLTAAKALQGNTDYIIGSVKERTTAYFTPLNVVITPLDGCIAAGGIKSKSGEIVIRTDKGVSKGDYIYISGLFFADYLLE